MLGAERINACMVGNSLKKLVRQAVECSKLARIKNMTIQTVYRRLLMEWYGGGGY